LRLRRRRVRAAIRSAARRLCERAEVLLKGREKPQRGHEMDRLNETIAVLKAGGFAIYPLAALAVLAAVIILEKGFVFTVRTRLPAATAALIESYGFSWD